MSVNKLPLDTNPIVVFGLTKSQQRGRENKRICAAEIVFFQLWWRALASLPLLVTEEIKKKEVKGRCTVYLFCVCGNNKKGGQSCVLVTV